jgi:hypothetical protein
MIKIVITAEKLEMNGHEHEIEMGGQFFHPIRDSQIIQFKVFRRFRFSRVYCDVI